MAKLKGKIMKKIINTAFYKFSVVLLLNLGIAGSSYAFVLDNADVGDVDTLIQTASKTPKDPLSATNLPNSGEQTEIDWVNLVLGTSFASTSYKLESASFNLVDNSSSIYASALNVTPSTAVASYFIVKNSKTWALFGNESKMNFAVFDASDPDLAGLKFNSKNPADAWVISHLTVFADGTTVPEPSILALMGLGLLGVGLMRRRKRT